MRLSRLLCRFSWYRRLRGGEWRYHAGTWIHVGVIEPIDLLDFTDNFCLRDDLQDFLSRCDRENQRERT